MKKMLEKTARIVAWVLSLALLAGCAGNAAAVSSAAVSSRAPAPERDIVVLYTNDVHCGVDDNIGYAALADCKKQMAADGSDVLLVDVGDAVQGGPIGTVSKGMELIRLMNQTGYDLSTVGNHEFDYGMEQFEAFQKEANFPYVCSNLYNTQTGERVLDAYRIFELGGVKLAFVGVATPATLTVSSPENFKNENGDIIYDFCQDKTGEKLYENV